MTARTRTPGDWKMRTEPDRDDARTVDDRMERLLQELTPVDLPPFYRTRLLAKLRAASRKPSWAARIRTPQFAWSVATVCVVALVLTVTQMRLGSPGRAPGVEGVSVAVGH